MPTVCAVLGCKNRKKTNPSLRLIHFPKDEQLCQKWLEACGRSEMAAKFNLRHARVCVAHFRPEDRFLTMQQRLLNYTPRSGRFLVETAVPTLNLPRASFAGTEQCAAEAEAEAGIVSSPPPAVTRAARKAETVKNRQEEESALRPATISEELHSSSLPGIKNNKLTNSSDSLQSSLNITVSVAERERKKLVDDLLKASASSTASPPLPMDVGERKMLVEQLLRGIAPMGSIQSPPKEIKQSPPRGRSSPRVVGTKKTRATLVSRKRTKLLPKQSPASQSAPTTVRLLVQEKECSAIDARTNGGTLYRVLPTEVVYPPTAPTPLAVIRSARTVGSRFVIRSHDERYARVQERYEYLQRAYRTLEARNIHLEREVGEKKEAKSNSVETKLNQLLSGIFSPRQIEWLISEEKDGFEWTTEDKSRAATMVEVIGAPAYELLRNRWGYPLPPLIPLDMSVTFAPSSSEND